MAKYLNSSQFNYFQWRVPINITDYNSLLAAAKQQPEPQRFLFVFLKASLPKDYNAEDEARFNEGQGGALQPLMCVDKPVDELTTFEALVEESKQMSDDWQIVIIAAMSGRAGIMPNSDEAKQPLEMMVQAVEQGGDLSRFMAFDKSGEPVQFS
jgi:hypothetical protein